METSTELRVCMDIGSKLHRVGIGLSTGKLLEEFDVKHTATGIDSFFIRVENYKNEYNLPVSVAMEAYNGHARPIDKYALERGYRLFNVNNNKLAQFKKVFPAPSKTDAIDTLKMFELFFLNDHLPMAKNVLEEIHKTPEVNDKLKRLTRRRSTLVDEKVFIINRMQSDIKAICPGLLDITGSSDNKWFLNFLTLRDDITKLKKIQETSLLKTKAIGKKYIAKIMEWQKTAKFSPDSEWVGEMIVKDAKRILALLEDIKSIEKKLELIIPESNIASRLATIPGFGEITAAVLAGEIGTITRFATESSLALYTGMGILDNSSGLYKGTKKSIHINKNCKRALMIAVAQHVRRCPESKKYYDKKRKEGKKHNQAVRSMGRHLIRVIWTMLKNDRDYKIKSSILKD